MNFKFKKLEDWIEEKDVNKLYLWPSFIEDILIFWAGIINQFMIL